MKYNSTAQKENSLYHDALFLAGITDTSQYPLVDFGRSANHWYRRTNNWIRKASGIKWKFDDRNWSTIADTTSDLTAGTQQYNIPDDIRTIERIEVLDNNGYYHLIKPIDKTQIKIATDEFYKTDGFPSYYELEGKYLKFYPAPAANNITASDGIKWSFTRDISPFSITDTATEPGFDNHFHRIISFGCSYDYCMVNNIADKKVQIREEIKQLREELVDFYGSRFESMPSRIIPKDKETI